MKRFFSLFLVLCMSCCCSATAMAAPASISLTGTLSSVVVLPNEDDQITPYGWPGTGAAPQITNIEHDDSYWNEEGNWEVRLKVTGYGSDRNKAFFNGEPISSEVGRYFINYGTTADGWYYTYDCGPITEPGDYLFETTFRSTNYPYSELTFQAVFTFKYQ